MIRYFHLRRISLEDLNAKLHGDSKIAMIDLLNFEDGELNEGIPGAIRIDPARLRHVSRVVMPRRFGHYSLLLLCTRDHKCSGRYRPSQEWNSERLDTGRRIEQMDQRGLSRDTKSH